MFPICLLGTYQAFCRKASRWQEWPPRYQCRHTGLTMRPPSKWSMIPSTSSPKGTGNCLRPNGANWFVLTRQTSEKQPPVHGQRQTERSDEDGGLRNGFACASRPVRVQPFAKFQQTKPGAFEAQVVGPSFCTSPVACYALRIIASPMISSLCKHLRVLRSGQRDPPVDLLRVCQQVQNVCGPAPLALAASRR